MAPNLIEELSNSKYPVTQKLDATKSPFMEIEKVDMNEKAFRWMLNEDSMATSKLAEGIRNFSADIEKLEAIIEPKLGPNAKWENSPSAPTILHPAPIPRRSGKTTSSAILLPKKYSGERLVMKSARKGGSRAPLYSFSSEK